MSPSSPAPLTAPSVTGRAQATAQRAADANRWISHSVSHLERWVAWSIAVYTAWVTLFSFPDEPAAWSLVLYAGLIGKWATARLARQQWEMAGRGIALVAGAFVLQTHLAAQLDDAHTLFFFWLSITCLCYAFLLKPVWGAIVVAWAVVAFFVGSLLAPDAPPLSSLIAEAGFLVIFPLLLTMKFGCVMRGPDEALENSRIDFSTALYNRAGFAAYGNELLAECGREGQPLSVAVFDCSDLLEVRAIYGNRMARKLANRIVRKLSSLALDRGLAARTGPAEFSVVLPGMGREKAISAIHRVLGNPMRIEMDAGHSEIVLVPAVLVETAGVDTTSVDEIQTELRDELERQQAHEQRRQLHMQRQRERQSKPMGLSPRAATA